MTVKVKRKRGTWPICPIHHIMECGCAEQDKVLERLFRRKDESRWSFWEDGVSSSLIALWLQCREQFRLEVVQGWRNFYTPLYFSFGTCGHWILQQAYAKKDPPDKTGVRKFVSQFEKLWRKEWPNAPQGQLDVQEQVYGLAEAVMPAYFIRWAGDFPGHKYPCRHNTATPRKWLGLETQFSVEHVFKDGKVLRVRGTRDGMLEDAKNELRVFDSKFRSVINEEDTLDALPKDLQQMLYNWATWEDTGQCPGGTTMNIVRRPGHRRGKEESWKNFFSRISKDLHDPKKWDHNFIRMEMDITKREIEDYYENVLSPIFEDMRAWWEGRSPHYMNPNALVSKYGRCAMFQPITTGRFPGMFQRPKGSIMSYQTDIT